MLCLSTGPVYWKRGSKADSFKVPSEMESAACAYRRNGLWCLARWCMMAPSPLGQT